MVGTKSKHLLEKKRIDLWRKGYTAGSADLIIGVPNRDYNGFAMQFKTPQGPGVLDENQQKYPHDLQHYKPKTAISHGCDELSQEIADYMRSVKFCCMYC